MSEKKPIYGILAGEPEIIGERCADGGTCHHHCTDTCWRRTSCAPLSGSGLPLDWSTGEACDSMLMTGEICNQHKGHDGPCGPAEWFASPAQTAPQDLRAIAMLVAEAAFKAGNGHDRSVASDTLREIVNSVFEQLGMQTAPQPEQSGLVEAGRSSPDAGQGRRADPGRDRAHRPYC